MANPWQKANHKTFPHRDEIILDILAGGMTQVQIADKYKITTRTVKRYYDDMKKAQAQKEQQQQQQKEHQKENKDKEEMAKEKEPTANTTPPVDQPNSETPPQPPPGTAASMQFNEAGLTMSIVIPPVTLTLFDFAKGAHLIPEDTDLDSWLFQCVQKMFELNYKLQLALIPVGEEV
jgi:predicted transcriptional regulator